jgi:hypothetical protein
MTNNRQTYFSPAVEVNEMVAEQGFAQSMFEDPIEKPEQGW